MSHPKYELLKDYSEDDDLKKDEKLTSVSLKNGWMWILLLRQAWLNIKKLKLQYCLGFFACFIVVFVVSIMITLILRSPIIFLRLAEVKKSEIDVQTRIDSSIGYDKMNATLAKEILKNETIYDYTHSTSRFSFNQKVFRIENCQYNFLENYTLVYKSMTNETSCERDSYSGCILNNCPNTLNYDSFVVGLNLDREFEIFLGRSWKYNNTLNEGECYISDHLAKSLKLKIGDYFWVRLSFSSLMGQKMWEENAIRASPYFTWDSNDFLLAAHVFAPFKVKDILSDWKGKVESRYEEIILLDYDKVIPYISKYINPQYIPENNRENISNFILDEYASSFIIETPPPRIEPYLSSDFAIIQDRIVKFASRISYILGVNQIQLSLPILESLRSLRMVSIFLGLILNIVIFILLFLSIVLIYSLLMISVETRTYEFGIFRMLGTTRIGIVALLLVQSFTYSIPACVFGLLIAFFSNIAISSALKNILGIGLGYSLSTPGVLYALLFGIVVPIAASILPIRKALGLDLLESLDTKRSKTKAVKISLKRAEDIHSIQWSNLAIGIGLVLFGASIYYFLPLSLLSSNFSLLMNIFIFLLIGLLLGLILLSHNFIYLIERFFVFVLLFWEHKAISKIVSKNLISHRLRNKKTSIMYSISLGFIIFLNVVSKTQISSLSYIEKQSRGSSVVITGSPFGANDKSEFENMAKNFSKIVDYTWMTYNLRDSFLDAVQTKIYNFGKLYSDVQHVYGVGPNYFRSTFADSLRIDKVLYSVNNEDLAKVLYIEDDFAPAIIGTTYRDYLGIDVGDKFIFEMTCYNKGKLLKNTYIMKAVATLSNAPGLEFSSFPLELRQDLIISIPTYYKLIQDCTSVYKSADSLPMRSLKLKVQSNSNSYYDQLKDIFKYLSLQIGGRYWDKRDADKDLNDAITGLNYFFTFTTIIAMAISFFSLMASMYANIYEQTKEIGILRALGVNVKWIYRIYIYEAFILVISSSFVGAIIGFIVAFTMSAQLTLFTKAPVQATFPWLLLFIVIILSIFFSIISSYSPTKWVLRKKIVDIFKLLS